MSSPSFIYVCAACGAPATKPKVAPHDPGKPALATLGSWRCTAKCTKGKCKVKRSVAV